MKRALYILLLATIVLPIVAATKLSNQAPQVTESDRRKASYALLEATQLRHKEQFDSYYDLLRYAHNLDPENSVISYYLAFSRLLINDITRKEFEPSFKLMQTFVDQHPDAFNENQFFAKTALAIDSIDVGIRVLKRLIATTPSAVELKLQLADAYARNENYPDAIATYNDIQKTEGQSVTISVRKVKAYQALNDTTGAINEMRALLATAPTNAELNLAMGRLLMQFGERDSVIHYFNLAQQYEPENGHTYLAKALYYQAIGDSLGYDEQTRQALMSKDLDVESKIDVLADYARQLLHEGDSTTRTTKLFDVILEQHPHEPGIRRLYSEYLAAKEDYNGAAEQLSFAVDLDPTNAELWFRKFILHMLDNNYPVAISVGERAIELNPDSVELYSYIAPAFYEMKQYDKAIKLYDTALAKVDSTQSTLRSNLLGGKGDVLFQMGDTTKAFECYEQALQITPENTGVMNNFAYFLSLANRDLERAERLSATAVQEEPENGTYLDTYAWVFFKRKNYSMALFYIEMAIKNLKESSTDVLEHYGDILWATGEHEKAVEQWEKALELDKDSEHPLLQRKVEDKTYYEK